ncbi:hypothetical protein BJX70DRAFT_368733, partial [Aspergillus crustosus]
RVEVQFSECFKYGLLQIRPRFMLAMGWCLHYSRQIQPTRTDSLQAMQHPAGSPATILFYAPRSLAIDIGTDYGPSLHVGAGLGLTYWIFSFVGGYCLDKTGRRPPLVYGALACAIAICFLCVRTSYASNFLFEPSRPASFIIRHHQPSKSLAHVLHPLRSDLRYRLAGSPSHGYTHQRSCLYGIKHTLPRCCSK